MKSKNLLPVIIYLFFFSIIFWVFSCNGNGNDLSPNDIPEFLLPNGTEDIPIYSSVNQNTNGNSEVNRAQLKVTPPDSFISQQIFDFNLDGDEFDEQIIVGKDREDSSDRIRLILADYDLLRGSYSISWQGEIQASNLRTLSVYTLDMTGNGIGELIASGTNNDGAQTLDVYRGQDSNFGLQLKSILSLQSDISIEIKQIDRGDSFEGITRRVSFPIIASNHDLESENLLDSIENTYTWISGSDRYLLSNTRYVTGSSIEEEQLERLYAGDLIDYLEFLKGIWQKYADLEGEPVSDDPLLLFDSTRNLVQLYRGDRQLSFNWLESTKSIYGGRLRLQLSNEVIRSSRDDFWLSVLGLNIISVNSQRNQSISGLYRRITPEQELIQADIRSAVTLDPIELSGLYRSQDNLELVFNSPSFIKRSVEGEESGAYAIYEAGNIILEMRSLSETGLPKGIEYYLVNYTEDEDTNSINRILELTPADLDIYGAQSISSRIIRLEQTLALQDLGSDQ